jgi:hypothetical protein
MSALNLGSSEAYMARRPVLKTAVWLLMHRSQLTDG